MLPSQDYLAIGESLKAGSSVRVDHHCGGGRTLKVSRPSLNTINAWCFRCNDGGSYTFTLNLAEMLANLEPVVTSGTNPEPPKDSNLAVNEWPSEAKLWLYKCGFNHTDIKRLNAYWSVKVQRVVLPLYTVEGQMVGYIARAVFSGHSPKYLSYLPSLDKAPISYGSNRTVVVLTEDTLSAYKVASRASVSAWPLLGTSLRSSYLQWLVKWKPTVVLWTDPDKGGDKARARILPTLHGVGLQVVEVSSRVDPKKLNREEILYLLRSVL